MPIFPNIAVRLAKMAEAEKAVRAALAEVPQDIVERLDSDEELIPMEEVDRRLDAANKRRS